MQMLDLKKKNKKVCKSKLILLGVIFIFIGIWFISFHYVKRLKSDVYAEKVIMIQDSKTNLVVDSMEDFSKELAKVEEVPKPIPKPQIDYSKYLGVLEIPKIGLKRGFYGYDSKWNTIQYNVTLVEKSNMPDTINGNLILSAHSGPCYNCFFDKLDRLEKGDLAIITYKGDKYVYEFSNSYIVKKTGKVQIVRDYTKSVLTLVTCTKDGSPRQVVNIFKMIN